MTPTTVLDVRAKAHPDRRFLRLDGHAFTYGELSEASHEVGSWLTEHRNIGPEDRVATMFTNGPAAVHTWLGIERTGAVEVPLNTALRGRLLAEQIETSTPRLLLVEADFVEEATAAAATLVNPPEIMAAGDDCAQIRSRSGARVERDLADTNPAVILYTSGTTGRSKGVVLPHRSTVRLSKAMVQHVGLRSDDVLFTAFPLFHIAARFVSFTAALLCGGEVVIHRRFSSSRFWDICRTEGVTAIHYLGTIPMMLFNQSPGLGDRDHPVRLAYGAGMPPPIFEAFEQRFGVKAHELYGSTEQGMVAINRGDDFRVGTCGRPLEDVDLEIHDAAGNPVAPGVGGEIVVRPREPHIFFSGYDRMPAATLESWRGLWFRTGDLGRLDEDGYLIFGGRLKEAIRRRGENISAWEVERAIAGFAGVDDVAAVGVPSDLGDEEVLAVVVAPDEISWEALVVHCEAELPGYAVPRYYRRTEVLPMTPTGRVRRTELAHLGDHTWDREHADYVELEESA